MPSSTNSERKVITMIPYVLLAILYLLTLRNVLPLPRETFTTATIKAAPIWYLVAHVGLSPSFSTHSLASWIWAGLVLSSIGDVCLIWMRTLFLPGVFFFALAQIAYIYGLKSWLRGVNYPSRSYMLELCALYLASFGFIFAGIKSWLMAVCVLVYFALVFTMANLALHRHLVERNQGSLYGAVGGVFFVVSDFLIGVDKCVWDFPMSEEIIMVTYYIAQGAIAFSAVSSARAKRQE